LELRPSLQRGTGRSTSLNGSPALAEGFALRELNAGGDLKVYLLERLVPTTQWIGVGTSARMEDV